jgi:elongation factor P
MISATEMRKGIIIRLEEKLYQVIDYQHVKMKRTALVRVKLKDIQGGHTTEQTFSSDQKFDRIRLDVRNVQYLYNDGSFFHFMDKETFEQIPLTPNQLGDSIDYLKEGMSLDISSYESTVIGIELPITIELKVTNTGPAFKGDTTTAGTKPAVLETGLTIQVPMFISNDDIIKVDTRNASYLERIS